MDGYKHVVNVAYYPAVNSDAPSFQQESAQGKAAAQASPSSKKADAYHDTLEGFVPLSDSSKHYHSFRLVFSCLGSGTMLQ